MFEGVPILAMANMTGVPYAVAVLLVVGVVILRRIRPPAADSRSRVWLPLAALIVGPSLTLLFFLTDVFLISRDYTTFDDYWNMFSSVMIIGVFGGVVGAIGLWAGDRIKLPRVR